MQRVKYPLTSEAKEWAKKLVLDWNANKVEQLFGLSYALAGNVSVYPGRLSDDFEPPPLSILLELSKFQLLYVDIHKTTHQTSSGTMTSSTREILLMQELRNAVDNNFAVSDYFLTLNAVGTIIQGNAVVNAPFQSAVSAYGAITQQMTTSEVADKLVEFLGRDLVETNRELEEAIQELRQAAEGERQSKIGKVISELGRSLEHVANTAVVVQALTFLAVALQRAS